jgi:myosin heavy subunit
LDLKTLRSIVSNNFVLIGRMKRFVFLRVSIFVYYLIFQQLQQHFNHHIFKLEQEEYTKEKINWQSITFVDNQATLDLVERKNMGVITILDEECRFPKGTDLTFLEKLHTHHAKDPSYEQPKLSKSTFIIRHYAGDVSYEVDGFLEKNRDTLQEELLDLLRSSGNTFIVEVFREDEAADTEGNRTGTLRGSNVTPTSTGNQKDTLRASGRVSKSNAASKKTVSTKFKEQLLSLIHTLSSTSPHYVRCVKPNSMKIPNTWDRNLVLAQLRYAGMMETIKIRRMGFPIRFPFTEFLSRYACIARLPANASPADKCRKLIAVANLASSQYQLGISKVFLKDGQRATLDDLRAVALSAAVIRMQTVWRGYRQRKEYLRIRHVIICAQTAARRHIRRKQYVAMKRAAIIIQSWERMRKPRRNFLQLRNVALLVQKAARGFFAREQYTHLWQEQRRIEESKRAERERVLMERAKMEEAARLELERREAEDRITEERKQDEERFKLDQQRRERHEMEKTRASEMQQETLRMQMAANLEELGILQDITNLADLIGNGNTNIPPPPPPFRSHSYVGDESDLPPPPPEFDGVLTTPPPPPIGLGQYTQKKTDN